MKPPAMPMVFPPLTSAEIEAGVRMWKEKYYCHEDMDLLVEPFMHIEPSVSWLHQVRKTCFKSPEQVAKSLRLTKTSYLNLEKGERTGCISLKNLKRCAEALGCELVYGLRPKDKKPFSTRISEILVAEALKREPGAGIVFRISALAYRMYELMHDPEFRRKQGWARNPRGRGQEVARFLNNIRAPQWRRATKLPSDLLRSLHKAGRK